MLLRAATRDDRPAIDAFAGVAVHDTYDPLVGGSYADELLDRWWGAALDADIDAGAVTVAVDDDRLVGLAQVGHHDGERVLWKLYVSPDRRSMGVGSALIDHVVAALPPGTEQLWVEHIAANVDAARFYRRHGFARARVDPQPDHRLATVWRCRPVAHAAEAGHGHAHDDFDWADAAAHLAAWDRAWAATYRDMVAWLGVGPGDDVADIGAGAGGLAAALGERVGPEGRVTLIDGNRDLLGVAQRTMPPGTTVSTVHADLESTRLSEQLAGRFDLVHAGAVVHHTDDQQRTVNDLAALLRPGGRLVLGEGGLAPRFLPSESGLAEPDLEVRLQAALIEWFWSHVRPPGATVETGHGWGELLRAADLTDIRARSFLLEVPPPLATDLRALVARALADAATRAGERLAPDDRAAIAALVDPARPDSVHHRPDVFILAARTLHVATAPTS